MAYFVVLILILLIGWFIVKAQRQTRSEASGGPDKSESLIEVSSREETSDGLTVNLSVDMTYNLRCLFYRNGSPWVDVHDIQNRSESSYNIKTSRWKEADSPVMPEYQRQLTNCIKSEWQRAWELFGRPKYDTGRKKPEPPPTHVDFEKSPITFEYQSEMLSSLPREYIAESSSGATYTVNLTALQCSCLDFKKRRSQYPENDIRRICKHQARAIMDLKMNTKLTKNSMIQALIRGTAARERGIPPFSRFYEITINEEIKGPNPFHVMMPEINHPWAEVLFFTKKSYVSHGYHLNDRRWGRHKNPFPAGSRQRYNWVMVKLSKEK